jgi:hypothetical protein
VKDWIKTGDKTWGEQKGEGMLPRREAGWAEQNKINV